MNLCDEVVEVRDRVGNDSQPVAELDFYRKGGQGYFMGGEY